MKFLFQLMYFSLLFFVGCKKPKQAEVEVLPVSPSELTVTLVSNTQATLNWVDKSTNESGFKVERKTGNGTFGVIATTNADVTTINDGGLIPNTTYTYRVYSFNNTGKSLTYTNEVTITTITLPTVTTSVIADTTGISASSGGNVTSDGGSSVLERGIVWSTSPSPTVALTTRTKDGSGVGQFTSKIDGLTKNTKYYVRAYATNAAGTSYGNELTFTTNNVDLLTGLVAYYPFNGNANDESGNGNNGVVSGAVLTNDRLGVMNKAYYFQTNTRIIVPNSTSLQLNQNISISLWIYALSNGQTIIRKDYDYGIDIGDITNSFSGSGLYPVFFPPSLISPTPIQLNSWNHIVAVRNGTNTRFYINGVLSGELNNATLFNVSGNPLTIGSWNGEIINARLDEVRIYNRALSQEEVLYLNKN